MTRDPRGRADARPVLCSPEILQRCLQSHEAMALALLAVCSALDQTRRALKESQAREARAWQQRAQDTLTGLPNRVAFARRSDRTLAAHARQRRGFGLLFVDLDGFKVVNDRLGHAAGDALLAIIGARLAHALRQGDFVSRHGGDEFVCLLPEITDDAQAMVLARKLAAAVAAPCQIGSNTLQLSASIGVALYPRDGSSVAELLERADHAMLWAKARHAGIGLAGQAPASPGQPCPTRWTRAAHAADDGNGTIDAPPCTPPRPARTVAPSGAADHDTRPP